MTFLTYLYFKLDEFFFLDQATAADNNCQQYFTGVSGEVKSFNYDEPVATSQYLMGTYDVSDQQ